MAESPRKVNWFAIWVSVGVVVALVVVAVLVVTLNNGASGTRPDSSGIDAETGAVVVGDGPDSLDLWFDFYCPHCQDFEAEYGDTVDEMVEAGEVTLNLFPVALTGLNTASGTDFSKRSANALYCVAEETPDAAYPFMQALFATNPTGPGQTDEELIALAEAAGAGDVSSCVTEGTYIPFVEDQTQKLPTNPETGGAGTPTVILNGEFVTLTGDPEADLRAALP
jgi:protein-disulfide isomerase